MDDPLRFVLEPLPRLGLPRHAANKIDLFFWFASHNGENFDA